MSIKINLIASNDAVLLGQPGGYRTANPFRAIMLSFVYTYYISYTKIIYIYGCGKILPVLDAKGFSSPAFQKSSKKTDRRGRH